MPRKSMLVFMVVLFLAAMGVSRAFTIDRYQQQMRTFTRILYEVNDNYYKEVDTNKLFEGAYQGMLQTLDPYSQYFNQGDATTFTQDTEGEFGGVGIEISLREGILTVITPIRGTPAYDAGILPGDIVLKIDGESTEGITLDRAVRRLRGRVGADVQLTVRHIGAPADTIITITRAVIQPASVEEDMLLEKEGIALIRVNSFSARVMKDMYSAIDGLEKQGMKALVIDMRQNPGGLLDKSVDMADMFLPQGKTIVSVRGRHKQNDRTYSSTGRGKWPKLPLVVLVDEGSASAAEILAAALRDNGRAMLVGARTYGKGSVQNVIPLGDGEMLKLTTAHYYRPNNEPIADHQGIKPDIHVPMTREMLIALRNQEREDKLRGGYRLRNLLEEGDDAAPPPAAAAAPTPVPGAEPQSPRRSRAVDFQLQAAANLLKWQLNGMGAR